MKDIMNFLLLDIGNVKIKVSTVLLFLIFIIGVYTILFLLKKTIYKIKKIDAGKKYSIYNLIKYIILVFSLIFGLQIFGVNISVVIASSAALLVGLGLGLQYLFSDFISGVILLLDSSIKVDDIIDVKGLVCKVQEINLRTTTVLTRDDKYIILPNTDLTRNQIINWTHSDLNSRFEINVGVDYKSDVKLVMKIMEEVVATHVGIRTEPKPFVRFNNFGDSSLDFTVYFWSEEVFRVENIKSDIRVQLFEEFKNHGINIPFPQRVIRNV